MKESKTEAENIWLRMGLQAPIAKQLSTVDFDCWGPFLSLPWRSDCLVSTFCVQCSNHNVEKCPVWYNMKSAYHSSSEVSFTLKFFKVA